MRDICEKNGYSVVRSAQSKGSADLVAGNGIQVILLQVKAWDSKLAHLTPEEEQALGIKAAKFRAVPVFARKNKGHWEYLRLYYDGKTYAYEPFSF